METDYREITNMNIIHIETVTFKKLPVSLWMFPPSMVAR